MAVVPQDVEERAFWAQKGDEIDRAWKAIGREKGKNVLMVKVAPNRDFFVKECGGW